MKKIRILKSIYYKNGFNMNAIDFEEINDVFYHALEKMIRNMILVDKEGNDVSISIEMLPEEEQ